MKKSLLILCAALTLQYSRAQVNPIPNADFENWSGTTLTSWYALSVAGCTKSTTAHSGSFALQMVPWSTSKYGANAYTPATGHGFPLMNLNPTSLTGWYKANFGGGDQLQVTVTVYSGGTSTGSGAAFINTNATSYTQFTVGVYNSGSTADSAHIQFTELTSGYSSMGLNAATTVTIDDLQFIGVMGVQNISAGDLALQVAPNPSENGIFNLSSGRILDAKAEISISAVTGKKLKSILAEEIFDGTKYRVDLSEFDAGIYFFTVISGNAIETKKLMITR